MEIRRAALCDLPLVMEVRQTFLREVIGAEIEPAYQNATKDYVERHLADGSLLCYFLEEQETLLSFCMLSLYETLPLPGYVTGRTGLLLNVYTPPEARKRGHAETLLRAVIQEAKRLGLEKLNLSFTDAGRPLYQKLGFQPQQREMTLSLLKE